MQPTYSHGYCRWKPIESKNKEIEFARDDCRDRHSKEMPYGCRGFYLPEFLMPDAMDVAHTDRRSRRMVDAGWIVARIV